MVLASSRQTLKVFSIRELLSTFDSGELVNIKRDNFWHIKFETGKKISSIYRFICHAS